MTQDLNKRKAAITKARSEAAATGLPTIYNPEHAETAILIDRLMQRLSTRFMRPPTYPERLYEEVKTLVESYEPLDLDKAKLLIEKADDAIKEFGNTNQERKVQLRKWKAQAELVLPPSTIDD